MDNNTLLGILITVILGVAAFFVTTKKSKNVIKGNDVKGDFTMGDKTTINLGNEKDK